MINTRTKNSNPQALLKKRCNKTHLTRILIKNFVTQYNFVPSKIFSEGDVTLSAADRNPALHEMLEQNPTMFTVHTSRFTGLDTMTIASQRYLENFKIEGASLEEIKEFRQTAIRQQILSNKESRWVTYDDKQEFVEAFNKMAENIGLREIRARYHDKKERVDIKYPLNFFKLKQANQIKITKIVDYILMNLSDGFKYEPVQSKSYDDEYNELAITRIKQYRDKFIEKYNKDEVLATVQKNIEKSNTLNTEQHTDINQILIRYIKKVKQKEVLSSTQSTIDWFMKELEFELKEITLNKKLFGKVMRKKNELAKTRTNIGTEGVLQFMNNTIITGVLNLDLDSCLMHLAREHRVSFDLIMLYLFQNIKPSQKKDLDKKDDNYKKHLGIGGNLVSNLYKKVKYKVLKKFHRIESSPVEVSQGWIDYATKNNIECDAIRDYKKQLAEQELESFITR